MTLTPHLDDDGLSAVLDGVGDPNETEHARDCVECQDRLAQWDAARKLVSAPVAPAPEDVRRAAIAAATRAAAPGRSAPVPRLRRPRLVQAVTGIAAALVIAGVAYAAAHNNNHRSEKSTVATSAPAPVRTATTTASPTAAAGGSAGGGTAGTSSRPGTGLGSFTSPEPLVAALRERLSGTASSSLYAGSAPAAAMPSPPACSSQAPAAAGNPRTGPVLSESLTYAGTLAVVYVYPRPGGDRAVVLGVSHCEVLMTANF